MFKKAERIGALLLDKGRLQSGDHVALIFPPGLELIASFYGCLTVGLIPVCIRAPTIQNLQVNFFLKKKTLVCLIRRVKNRSGRGG